MPRNLLIESFIKKIYASIMSPKTKAQRESHAQREKQRRQSKNPEEIRRHQNI